tara:strand:- start:350 stop:1375 length:1026 start_codon:yes stop_codon:yes gene_type:complete
VTGRMLLMVVVTILLFVTHASAQETHVLVITGLGGNSDYTQQFHKWATKLLDVVVTQYGVPSKNITYLSEEPSIAPDTIKERSSQENIKTAVKNIAELAEPVDHVVIVLFGHGSFSDSARINLPGRDLSASDFSTLLDGLDVQFVTFVNTASASGPFVEELSGEGRVVMTATRTGAERNASVFGGHFVDAFADGREVADQNKDSRVSMLEAFIFARFRVDESYEKDGNLVTEHAMLDDNGDGVGTTDPDPLNGDGAIARTLFFTRGGGVRPEVVFPDDPALRVLYEERQVLEDRVDDLRRLEGGIDPEQYQQQLEQLLIELALKSREIREQENTGEGSGIK